ncbi:tetratricopeptide repeat protein [Massilia atriviolacea]|uniref:Tetratricopeptide repeat protein n=1 Tax=Massilia atriviolacea TaxID=2495579 RepID=A0A430HHU3_9BURK|nr:tetratricopeptide repeat protein [Massilia atriviolacea]RSZ57114.1 tetratricopeptide repeat protein [Massilia atriviolacea]
MQEPTSQEELTRQRDRTESYLKADPNNKQLLTRAIELNLALSNPAGAEPHALAAVAAFPHDPMIVCLQAHVFAAQQRWSQAAPIYAGLLAQISDPDLAFSLATCQVWLGQHQAALDTMAPFERAPDLPAATVTLLVRAYHHVGKLDRAIELIEHNEARLATDPVFMAAASMAYIDSNKGADAVRMSAAALAHGERPIEALVVSATLCLENADADGALAQFQEALALNPQEGRIWNGLGMANLLKQDFATAEQQLERASELMPTHIATWNALGWCRLMSNRLPEADVAFARSLELDRNLSETHGSIALVAALRGDRSVAEAALQRAMRLNPQCVSGTVARMALDGQLGDIERFRATTLKATAGRKNLFGVEFSDIALRVLDAEKRRASNAAPPAD